MVHEVRIFDQEAKKIPSVYWEHSGETLNIKVGHECAMAAAMADRMVQITFIILLHLLRRSWLMILKMKEW